MTLTHRTGGLDQNCAVIQVEEQMAVVARFQRALLAILAAESNASSRSELEELKRVSRMLTAVPHDVPRQTVSSISGGMMGLLSLFICIFGFAL